MKVKFPPIFAPIFFCIALSFGSNTIEAVKTRREKNSDEEMWSNRSQNCKLNQLTFKKAATDLRTARPIEKIKQSLKDVVGRVGKRQKGTIPATVILAMPQWVHSHAIGDRHTNLATLERISQNTTHNGLIGHIAKALPYCRLTEKHTTLVNFACEILQASPQYDLPTSLCKKLNESIESSLEKFGEDESLLRLRKLAMQKIPLYQKITEQDEYVEDVGDHLEYRSDSDSDPDYFPYTTPLCSCDSVRCRIIADLLLAQAMAKTTNLPVNFRCELPPSAASTPPTSERDEFYFPGPESPISSPAPCFTPLDLPTTASKASSVPPPPPIEGHIYLDLEKPVQTSHKDPFALCAAVPEIYDFPAAEEIAPGLTERFFCNSPEN